MRVWSLINTFWTWVNMLSCILLGEVNNATEINGSFVMLSLCAGYVQLDIPMANTTKYEGETMRIKCEITGFPLPRYQWFKNGILLEGLQGQTAAASPQQSSRLSAKTTPWGSRYFNNNNKSLSYYSTAGHSCWHCLWMTCVCVWKFMGRNWNWPIGVGAER